MEVGHGLHIPLAQQTLWFLMSLLLGGGIAAFYALLRAVTHRLPRRSVGTALGDCFFCMAMGAMEFVFILMLPANAFRWFHFVGQVIGAVLLRITVGRMIFRGADRVFLLLGRGAAAAASALRRGLSSGPFRQQPKAQNRCADENK